MTYRWGILWRHRNRLDGYCEHLVWDHRSGVNPSGRTIHPMIFATRKEAREYIKERYSYLCQENPDFRLDLKREPFGWLRPIPVKVFFVYQGGGTHGVS